MVDSFRWDSNPIEDRRTILKNHYEKEVNLTSTYSDRRCELGIFQAALLLQDAITELDAETLNDTMLTLLDVLDAVVDAM